MIRALCHGCRLGARSTGKASSPAWSAAPAGAAPRRQLSILGHIGDDRKGALRAAFDESKGRLKGMREQGKAPAIPSLRAPPPGPAAAPALSPAARPAAWTLHPSTPPGWRGSPVRFWFGEMAS